MDFSSQFKPKRNFWSLFQVLYSYSGIRPKDCALTALTDGEEWTPTREWTSCVTAVVTSDQMQMVFFFNFKLITDHFGFFV